MKHIKRLVLNKKSLFVLPVLGIVILFFIVSSKLDVSYERLWWRSVDAEFDDIYKFDLDSSIITILLLDQEHVLKDDIMAKQSYPALLNKNLLRLSKKYNFIDKVGLENIPSMFYVFRRSVGMMVPELAIVKLHPLKGNRDFFIHQFLLRMFHSHAGLYERLSLAALPEYDRCSDQVPAIFREYFSQTKLTLEELVRTSEIDLKRCNSKRFSTFWYAVEHEELLKQEFIKWLEDDFRALKTFADRADIKLVMLDLPSENKTVNLLLEKLTKKFEISLIKTRDVAKGTLVQKHKKVAETIFTYLKENVFPLKPRRDMRNQWK